MTMDKNPPDGKMPIPPLPPKSPLYKGINFWSQILLLLDKKAQYMEENLRFGKVGVTLHFREGKLSKIFWVDEISEDMDHR